MALKDRILSALEVIAGDWVDEQGVTIDPNTRHILVDPTMFVSDEIDLTKLSELLADAITIKVDPAEPAKGDA